MRKLSKKDAASLRARMKRLDWNDAALAFKSGLNPTTVWRVLGRKTATSRVTLRALERALEKGEADAGMAQESA